MKHVMIGPDAQCALPLGVCECRGETGTVLRGAPAGHVDVRIHGHCIVFDDNLPECRFQEREVVDIDDTYTGARMELGEAIGDFFEALGFYRLLDRINAWWAKRKGWDW